MVRRILIVETHAAQARALIQLLQDAELEYECVHAANLSSALAVLRDVDLDAALVDIELPDSHGLDTLSAICAASRGTPIIVLTAAADAELGPRALALGADEYLLKSEISGRSILRCLRYSLERREFVRRVERRAQQQHLIADVGLLALNAEDLSELRQTICSSIASTLDIARVAIFEVDAEHNELLLGETCGWSAGECGEWKQVSKDAASPVAEAFRTRGQILVSDIEHETRFDAESMAISRGSGMYAVVRDHGELPFGVISANSSQPYAFSEPDLAFLGAMANILSAAAQRLRITEQLRASRTELHEVLSANPDLIARYDRDLRICFANPSLLRALGKTRQQVQGLTIAELGLQPADERLWQHRLNSAMTTAQAQQFDVGGTNGKSLFDVRIIPEWSGSEVRSLISIARDVTDRLRTQARFHALFDVDLIGIIFFSENGILTEANHAFLELVGYSRDEIVGIATWETLTPPEYRSLDEEKLRELARRGVCRPYEKECARKDGTRIPVLVGAAMVGDEIVSFVLDQSYVKEAEETIRSQMYVLNSARDAIVLRDLDGEVQFWSDGAARMYGWPAEEVVGRNVFDLIYQRGDTSTIGAREEALRSGQWSGELIHVTRDGRRLTVESRWSVLPSAPGERPTVLVISTDVTEKRSLEGQLLRAQRIEGLGTLAGGIAHDLNNILMPILLGVNLLRRATAPQTVARTIDSIEQSTRRAADLIRQLLTFARGQQVDRTIASPDRLIAEVEKIVRETFPPSIEFVPTIDSSVWNISCDTTQMHQVLLNLCVNARDAMAGGGGVLAITCSNVQLEEAYARLHVDATVGMYVMISVVDSGTGIDHKVMDSIFDPFFTTKEPGHGTGLGLSTARSIVKAHGGFMTATSAPGEGAEFRIYLPALHTKEDEQVYAVEHFQDGNGELILVIDDEESVREITRTTLETYGYRVLTASDGSEGLALYAKNSDIALVLTDMLMPLIDGATTVRALHRIDPAAVIIAMSGLDISSRGADISSYVKATIQKPFTAEKLLSTIAKALE
jgi:PAS domain S-box-containing protein